MNGEHNGQEILDEKLPATTAHDCESKPVTGPQAADGIEQSQHRAAGDIVPTTLQDASVDEKGLVLAVSDDRPRSPRNASPGTTKTDPPSPTDPDVPSDTYPEGGLRAWLVVLGAFSGMTASFGLMNTMGTFQPYISTHQLSHLSQSTIGWIFSVYVFTVFFCGVQIGPVFDAKGPRALIAAGSVCMVAGTLGLAESTGMEILLRSSIYSAVTLLVVQRFSQRSCRRVKANKIHPLLVQNSGTSSSPSPSSAASAAP